jgi:hypothetical protein
MNKLIFITILLLGASIGSLAQKQTGFGFFTDRDVYVSGETLLAKFYIPFEELSGIVHLDLVNTAGKRISGVSIEIKDNEADGYFQLPDSLHSGTYFLRAYLRNSADKSRMIKEIWVSNRFDGLEKTDKISQVENVELLPVAWSNTINISGLDDEIKTNLHVKAEIQIEEKLLERLDGNLLISVVQFFPQFESHSFQRGNASAFAGLTERKGIILSGTVTDKITQTPATGIAVYLTSPDSIPEFQYYITGKDGRFYFLINNYSGDIQTVIQCFSNNPAQRLKITQDEPYTAVGEIPDLSYMPVSEEFRNEVSKSIDAVTFQKIFGQEMLSKLNIPKKEIKGYPFYGIPTIQVDPQLFIDLPNFNEISKELLPGVKYRIRNNEPSMQVINAPMRNFSYTPAFFDEQPLTLIDGIPVRDLNLIKDLGSNDIDRIDVCQSERYYGNLKFPGVVAIYTTKNDFSLLPETDQLLKLKTEGKQIPAQLKEFNSTEPTVPDLRQTLLWNPSVEPGKSLEIKFDTSNIIGHFKMVVRGRTSDGTLIFTEKIFEIK